MLFGTGSTPPLLGLRRRRARRHDRLPASARCIGWGIGVYGGRPLLERHGRWLHLSPEKLDRAERWFERRGDWAVFLGRLTPVVRSFISIPAGVFRSPLGRVHDPDAGRLGDLVLRASRASAGRVGTSYRRVHEDFRWVDYAVIAVVVVWPRRGCSSADARPG